MATVNLFGLGFWQAGFRHALSALEAVIWEGSPPPKIAVTPNTDHIVKLHASKALLNMYRSADFVFPDGFPVLVSSRLLGKRISERVTGADLFPSVCRRLAAGGGKAFVLGGKPGGEERICQKLSRKYAGLNVLAYSPAYGFTEDGPHAEASAETINAWKPNVVFACLGTPRQELWAFKWRAELRANLVLCLGAALDFDMGDVQRAPRCFRSLGLEWLWRLLREPGRLGKRYLLDDLGFLKILWQEFVKSVPKQ